MILTAGGRNDSVCCHFSVFIIFTHANSLVWCKMKFHLTKKPNHQIDMKGGVHVFVRASV